MNVQADNTRFIKVNSISDIAKVATLADEIWNGHYVSIIGQQQVDYMVKNFQSETAISQQIDEGVMYFMVNKQNQTVGYFAIIVADDTGTAQISKLYVIMDQQGYGVGRAMISFIETFCLNQGVKELWLTVNKNNTQAISFYQKLGFNNSGELVQDIGHGFVMDDYIMKKLIIG